MRKKTPPAKHAVDRGREKLQPYANESETYDAKAVKSPVNSDDLADSGDRANARAEDIGKPHPGPEKLRRGDRSDAP